MDYLLWSKEEVRSGDLSEKQIFLWEAVQRVVHGADSHEAARHLIEKKVLSKEELTELIAWIKMNRPKPRKRRISQAFRRRGCY